MINEVANLINHDPTINDKLKVVFLENYNVTLAERIIPAADVSEQISLASKESFRYEQHEAYVEWGSHDRDMDGANIEIRDASEMRTLPFLD